MYSWCLKVQCRRPHIHTGTILEEVIFHPCRPIPSGGVSRTPMEGDTMTSMFWILLLHTELSNISSSRLGDLITYESFFYKKNSADASKLSGRTWYVSLTRTLGASGPLFGHFARGLSHTQIKRRNPNLVLRIPESFQPQFT